MAGFIAAPLWNKFFTEALKNLPIEEFEKPVPMPEPKPILAGVWQMSSTTPQTHDTLYWLNKDDPLGPQPTDPYSDYQFKNWEAVVQKWAKEHGY